MSMFLLFVSGVFSGSMVIVSFLFFSYIQKHPVAPFSRFCLENACFGVDVLEAEVQLLHEKLYVILKTDPDSDSDVFPSSESPGFRGVLIFRCQMVVFGGLFSGAKC